MRIKKFLKKLAALSPVPFTTNEYYDRLTERVLKMVCNETSVCVDVGANEGKILSMFIRHCPAAIHYAFEPIPSLYFTLKRKFGSAANIYKVAVSNREGISNFNYVLTDPAYSGLVKRAYDKPEKDEEIQVQTKLLDQMILPNQSITLIKLDIEGGEYNALQGAERILTSNKPYLLFEFGKAGASAYNISPAMMFTLLQSHNYSINTLPSFLSQKHCLTADQFENFYNKGSEYFFIAYASDNKF